MKVKNLMKKASLAVLLAVCISSCSSPESQIKDLIAEGYEATNGEFDNSEWEDKLDELKDELKDEPEMEGLNARRTVIRAWKEVRKDYWTKEMKNCFDEKIDSGASIESLIADGGCTDVSKRIAKDFGKRNSKEGAELIMTIAKELAEKY